MFLKRIRISMFTILLAIFIISTLPNPNSIEQAKALPIASRGLSQELTESLEGLKPSDTIVVWVDIKAVTDISKGIHFPSDPRLYGMRWLLVTFDPNIDQNQMFWALAEIEVGKVYEIFGTSCVKDITLVRRGRFVQLPQNPKFAMEGTEYAVQRAVNEGNKSLQVILYVKNQTSPAQERLAQPGDDRDVILADVTSCVGQLGGEVLRTGPYKNKFLARIPSHVIENVTENPYVSEIYLNGPIIFQSEPFVSSKTLNTYLANDIAVRFGSFMFLGSIIDFATADKKNRRRRSTLYVVAISCTAFASVLVPSTQALDVSTAAIRATNVWQNTGMTGAGVNVAVIDSGIDFSHKDFPLEAIKASWNLPDNNATLAQDIRPDGHGTGVAGVIAGRGIENTAYRGVAWGSRLVVVRIDDQYEIDDAVDWVRLNKDAYDIKVLNLSWLFVGVLKADGLSVYTKAVDDAVEAGISVIISAGNYGLLALYPPADSFNAITVGAIDDKNTPYISDDEFDNSSSRGPTKDEGGGRPKPDVVAPGVNITTTNRGGGYAERDGTSFSAPHVAGTVALMLQANPNLTPAQVKAILRQTAKLNTNLNGLDVNDRGYGIIDAYAAVQWAQNVNNLNSDYMFDLWNVKTPDRHLDSIGKAGDYVTFTVYPSSTFGPSIAQIKYNSWDWWVYTTNHDLIWHLSAPYVWIDGTYYNLGSDMKQYLFSGPRIYERNSDGNYVLIRSIFRIGNVKVEYLWKIHPDEMWLKLNFIGGSRWRTLMYIDPDVWDTTNYAYIPSTNQTIQTEIKIYGDVPLDIRDPDPNHNEYIQIDPESADNPRMWVLTYGDWGNNPDSVLDNEYVYSRDIIVYYQATSYVPDPGPVIHRKTNPLVTPNSTQNDAGKGGDAGNTFDNATSIDVGTYNGILSISDPEDTNDWYQFYAAQDQEITVGMTPPSSADFDLELYSPDDPNTAKAARHLGVGSGESISYITDVEGQWRARIYIVSGEGQYSFYLSDGSEGGGCPILSVYRHKQYVSEGLLDIHNIDGIDVIKNHTLTTTPQPVGGAYLFRLVEHQQTISLIDHVKLYAILENETTIELPLISAIHSEYGDVLWELQFSDDRRVQTLGATFNNGTSQSIYLEFGALSPYTHAVGFIFQIEGNNMLIKP